MTLPAQDIVERLRKGRLALLGHEIFEAADLIESLTAENEALTKERDDLQSRYNKACVDIDAKEYRADALAQEVERLKGDFREIEVLIREHGKPWPSPLLDVWRVARAALGDRP